jgi:hypothetical protein
MPTEGLLSPTEPFTEPFKLRREWPIGMRAFEKCVLTRLALFETDELQRAPSDLHAIVGTHVKRQVAKGLDPGSQLRTLANDLWGTRPSPVDHLPAACP